MDMAHLALYRKFRPLIFDDVVGQERVVHTIKNQIKSDSFAHAYLFNGIRGTGKTTIAKIFARAINCLNPQGVYPCNECSVCQSILSSASMDIIEMDAASNNSVDDIREINDNVNFPPSNAKYKVYIIDEVHMLSKGAFNALLKTLEEPPEYVVFMLATTEPNKIPDTILSRCQRYDLKRVGRNDVLKRLEYIMEALELTYEQEAMDIIISKGEGSVRDSLSILDQCLSYSEELTYDLVIKTLGLIEISLLNDLIEAFIKKDTNRAINIIHSTIDEGKDVHQLIESLIEHFRSLLLVKMHKNPNKLIEASEEQIQLFLKQSESFELIELTRAINILIDAESNIKYSTHGKVLLEMAVIKMFTLENDHSIEGLILKVKDLENKIENLDFQNIKQSISSKEKTIENSSNQGSSRTKREEKQKPKVKYETTDSIEAFIDEGTQMKISIEEVQSKWNEVLKIVKKVKIQIYAFLIETEPIDTKGNKIVLKLHEDYKFHGDNLMKTKNRKTIEDILQKVYSKALTIDVTYQDVQKKTKIDEGISVDEELSTYFSDYDKVLEIKE
jgi:DNA polymerase-3 subunit gamma/tau